MLVLLIALILAAAVAPLLIRLIGRIAFAVLAIVPAAGFAWVLSLFINGTFEDGGALWFHAEWVPSAHLNIHLRLDSLAALFSLIILGAGALVLLYCWGYFDSNPPRLAKFGGEMVSFAAAMYGLVISDSFLLMYVFWEITSVLSFMLVGYYGERASSRRAAGQALMVTTLGGLSMLVGIILLGRQTGVWHLSQIPKFNDLAETPYILAAVLLILAGALSKSAIAPAHFWLPGAMAAPTPVSAYLHSAAMVKAGIYLVARLAPDFRVIDGWHLTVISMGLFTMLLGGWMALKHKDLKLILAYGTVSQLGFIMAVTAIGSREAMQAGLALTFSHTLFKAALFMIVGAIDHATGTRDVRELSGLGRREPLIAALGWISALSMAGIPPLWGFIAKESALTAVLEEDLLVGMPRQLMMVGLVVGSVLTMTYALYFLHGAFATKPADHPSGGGTSVAVEEMEKIGPTLWLAPAVLSALTVLFGLWPKPMDVAIGAHVANVDKATPADEAAHLALWHGFTVPLLLTAVIVALGAVLFWQRGVLAQAQFEKPALGSADHAYDAVLNFFRNLSLRLTASTQRGSLSVNLAVIFMVLILLPGIALITGERTDVRVILWDNPWQGLASAIIIVAAVAVTLVSNRLSAVILVGVTGFSIAFIFASHGAPDLALTQLLVETIVMVLFMLVLRKMPTEIDQAQTTKYQRLRAWLAIATGLAVTVVAMFAMNARITEPASALIPDLAYEIGHGANAVNVILVDIRAWDTFGEISVLVVAATGVASLIYRTRSFSRGSRRPTLKVQGRRWLASGVESERAQNRSLLVDVTTRILFPSMIVLSLYFFFAGHNSPGGGFAGGLVAGLAFTLRYLAGGRAELEEALPIDAGKILGTGLLLALAGAIWPMFLGQPPITSHIWDLTLPLIGDMHVPSALLFDAGVYVIVVGLIKHILDSMGAQLDLEEEMRKQRARDRARSMQRAAEHRRRQAQRQAARSASREGPLPTTPRGSPILTTDTTAEEDN
ncbi:Na+/H+ antiporter subunit A [Corynebacterium guangdongense]|uniref:Multicomponent Na+:H+ antiporter subunit A n=1 Tax=Corynebacterium guangdongense TaxID=1783348 RepID=A0ABU1ZZK1_9CORY|nr:Na+/H+ antiporter subunit A [Corynebacterium guangdongense]MDR7330326.1 multicomponent Na+:H+ antiporter subunit A [Corynebacterium guangdongense]WJZ18884.1 Na(+)/H(+) antiporter subunit A [Corynebacterium guangdongense]